MKQITIKYLITLNLTVFTLFGYAQQDEASLSPTIEKNNNISISSISNDTEPKNIEPQYGEYTDEIEKFLSTTPIGSDIYLEKKESGEWYLKVEKTFTVQKDQEETKIIEPLYGESILI